MSRWRWEAASGGPSFSDSGHPAARRLTAIMRKISAAAGGSGFRQGTNGPAEIAARVGNIQTGCNPGSPNCPGPLRRPWPTGRTNRDTW